VVQRVARHPRGDAADRALALLDFDRGGRRRADVAGVGALEAIVAADADVLEREPEQRGVAEGGHRGRELGPEAGAGAIEVLERELPAEDVHPDGERRLAEVRLREGEDDVAADRADVAAQHETLTPPEEVVLLDADVEEERVGRAEARPGAERSGLR